jgi:hypothetical protein
MKGSRARLFRGSERSQAAERSARSDAWHSIAEGLRERDEAEANTCETSRQQRVAHPEWLEEEASPEQLERLAVLLRTSAAGLRTRSLTKYEASVAIEMTLKTRPGNRTQQATNLLQFAHENASAKRRAQEGQDGRS